MGHFETMSTQGLTHAQAESLQALSNAYRVKNTQAGRQLTQEQLAVPGKITIELTK